MMLQCRAVLGDIFPIDSFLSAKATMRLTKCIVLNKYIFIFNTYEAMVVLYHFMAVL